ncbi:MAG: hypothetical protein AAEJ65_08880 [Planctomycetota bacterium]
MTSIGDSTGDSTEDSTDTRSHRRPEKRVECRLCAVLRRSFDSHRNAISGWLLLLVIGPAMSLGCAGNGQRATSTWISPAQHAVSQVNWMKARAGQLTPEQVYLLQQLPWRADGATDGDRQKMFDLDRAGQAPGHRFGRQRVLGRPRVMDAAREELRARLEREKPASTTTTESRSNVENVGTNSRGTESTPVTTGAPGEDGGRR